MKGFRRFSVFAVVISLLLFAGSLVNEAQAYRGKDEAPMGRLLKGLDLTDAQRLQIKEIMQTHRNDMLAGRLAVLQARQNLMAVTTSSTFDEKAVETAYSSMAAAQETMTVMRAKIFSEVMPVLTPEQQTELKNNIAKAGLHIRKTIERLQSRLNQQSKSNP